MTALHSPCSRTVPASSGVTLPPLECLFTVQEEVGLRGAFDLDASMVKGRTMLNLVNNFPPTLILCEEALVGHDPSVCERFQRGSGVLVT